MLACLDLSNTALFDNQARLMDMYLCLQVSERRR